MTKRVLSLLLALVMALSLCVPAFAADDNEQEPAAEVNEVEESAPVADEPVESEADEVEGEAEEVQGEIMTLAADEPVDVSVDEPEATVLLQLPVLEAVVAQAQGMAAGVAAGDYQCKDYTGYFAWGYDGTDDTVTETAIKDFQYWLKDAADLLASIEDMGADVWELEHDPEEIDADIAKLDYCLGQLTPNTNAAQKDNLNQMKAWYQAVIDDKTAVDPNDYQPAYVAKVKEALAQVEAAITSGLFKDYKTARQNWGLHGLNSAEYYEGILPTYNDYLELQDVIRDARNKLAGDSYWDNWSAPGGKGILAWIADNAGGLAERYDSSLNGFKSDVTLYNVHVWEKMIKDSLKDNVHTLKLESAFVEANYKTIYVAYSGLDRSKDHHDYILKVTVNGTVKTYGPWNDKTPEIIATRIDASDFFASASVTDKDRFHEGDKVDIALYCYEDDDLYDGCNGGELVQALATIVIDESYNGPIINGGSYNAETDTLTFTLNKSMLSSNTEPTAAGKEENLYYGKAYVELVGPDGKTVEKKTLENNSTATSVSFKLTPPVLGPYTAKLTVEEGQVSGAQMKTVARGSYTVTVGDITNYKGEEAKASDTYPWGIGVKGYNNLVKAVEVAADMDKLVAKSGVTADAKTHLQHRLDIANAIIAAASTTVDCKANRTKVDAALTELLEALKNFDKAVDTSKLDSAIASFNAMIKSDYLVGKGERGEQAWKDLEAAVKAGKDILAKQPQAANIGTPTNQKVADAAAKAIEDAIKKVKDNFTIVPHAEIETLQALVDSVPARLAADNYTAASKKAVEDAAAAAKALIATKGVLRSQIIAATNNLQAALNALVVEVKDPAPAEPTPPSANYTGWYRVGNDWYYFENGSLRYNKWIYSVKGLWYYVGADGKMLTGFQYVENNWYMFRTGGDTVGCLLSGWIDISAYRPLAGKTNWGWFTTSHKGNFGKCTYTTEWGDIQIS